MICRNCGGEVTDADEHRNRGDFDVVAADYTCPPVDWIERWQVADQCAQRLAGALHESSERVRVLEAEQDEIWTLLITTKEEAADDPDTARLPDAVRVSLEFERARNEQAYEAFKAEVTKNTDLKMAAEALYNEMLAMNIVLNVTESNGGKTRAVYDAFVKAFDLKVHS